MTPLSSETVRKSFPLHGYSKVLLSVSYRLLGCVNQLDVLRSLSVMAMAVK